MKKKKIDLKTLFSGASLSMIFVILFIVILLADIIFGSFQYSGKLHEGDIVSRSIYAPYDFTYPWGIDEGKTAKSKEEAKRRVPLILRVDNSREESIINNLSFFFDELESIAEIDDKDEKGKRIEELKIKTGIDLSEDAVLYLSKRENKDEIKASIVDTLTSVYPLGIVDAGETEKLFADVKYIKLINDKIKTERMLKVKDILTVEKAQSICKEYSSRIFSRSTRLKNHSQALINELLSPNIIFDKEKTEKNREYSAKNTPPIYNIVEVKKNELVVERGKRVIRKHILQLTQLGIIGKPTRSWVHFSGLLLLIILLVAVSLIYLRSTGEKLVGSPKEVSIILLNSLFVILIGQTIIQSPWSSYIIPLSYVSVLLTLLISSNVAFITTVVLSIFLGLIAGGKAEVMFVLLIGGFAGSYIVRGARRRSTIILAGFIAGIAQSAAIIATGLINNLGIQAILNDALWGLASGVPFAFILVMGLLPVFEYAFKVTTNITLLELSDLNYPLLKELTLKAPGTYQHSIMVGNLAEVACDAIGSNSLLARVGSYYHDIGKIEKAEYFSENEMAAKSKHEKLTPSMSALIIVNHVKDGIELAKRYKVNPKIVEFIAQHHGAGLIYYFYQRALERAKADHELIEEEFRYPGPKPQTKETAIVLLADSVEASSRSLSDPTPARIRSLVQKIINNKFIDNQLDECELTLKDLNKISVSFVRVLTAVFHTRLEYPEKKNIPGKRSGGKNRY